MSRSERLGHFATALAMLALFGACLWAMTLLEQPAGSDPFLSSSRFAKSLEQFVHSSAGVFLAVALLCVVDTLLLPWLSIRDVALGTNAWANRHPTVRAATTVVWGLIAWAIIAAVSSGTVAL